ncbi:alpha/beta hydrolase [Limnohabitans sp.]|uniref:alpha/beta hydrolase n=1 Tax=Limnohabitans sp. TaxID=1907725 RepID=UPI00286F5193|nr:alpha/beta hydrolase [Limnohabitans sp.]
MTHRRNPQSLLTLAMRDVLHAIAKAGRPPIALLTPEQAKQAFALGAGVLEVNAHKMVRDDTLHIPARDGATLRAKLWAEHASPHLPVLLYFHGGGFTVGSPETHEALCKHLAHLAHCAVVSLDYRLAPKHTFPTAHNDAFDALQWLAVNAASLGLDATRIAIGGDSAGGTLTASTAIAARDAGIDLKLQLMFYPGCSPEYLASAHTFEKGFLLEKTSIEYFYGHYVPDLEDRQNPRFSPMLADVTGVAPAWLGLAECDPLVDEGGAYADHLRLSGVPVDLEIYKGVVHSFIQMGRVIPEALTAHADAARALRHAFGL